MLGPKSRPAQAKQQVPTPPPPPPPPQPPQPPSSSGSQSSLAGAARLLAASSRSSLMSDTGLSVSSAVSGVGPSRGRASSLVAGARANNSCVAAAAASLRAQAKTSHRPAAFGSSSSRLPNSTPAPPKPHRSQLAVANGANGSRSGSSTPASSVSSSLTVSSNSSSGASGSVARRVPTLAMSLRDKDQQIKLLIKERDEHKFQAELMARRAEDFEDKFHQSELERSHVTSEADDEVVELRRLAQELEDENKRLAVKLAEREQLISDSQFKLDELEIERLELAKELSIKCDEFDALQGENELILSQGKPIVQVTTERARTRQNYEREIEELKERCMGKDEQMIQLRSSLEMRKQEVMNLQMHSGELEKRLKIETERNERHLKRLDEINLELKAAEAKYSTKLEEAEMLERQVRQLRQDLRSAEEKLEQVSLARKKDVDILHNKLAAARRGSTTPSSSPQPSCPNSSSSSSSSYPKTPTPQDEMVRLQMEIRDLKDQLIDREAELDCNRRELEVTRRKMETRTLEVDCNNQELARRCQDLMEQNRQSEDTIKQLLKSNTDYSAQVVRATDELKLANSKCSQLREEIGDLERKLDEHINAMQELKKENLKLNESSEESKQQAEQLRQQIDSLNNQLSELCQQLDVQTNGLYREREILANQVSQMEIDIAQLRQDLATAKQDLRSSKLQTNEMISERDRIRSDLEMKEKYIKSRNDIIEALRSELEDSKRSLGEYKQRVETLRTSYQTLEQESRNGVKELETQLETLRRECQIKVEQIESLKTKSLELQANLDRQQTESANKLEKLIQDHQTKSVEEDNKREEDELQRFDEMRRKHSVELDELNTKIANLELQLQEAISKSSLGADDALSAEDGDSQNPMSRVGSQQTVVSMSELQASVTRDDEVASQTSDHQQITNQDNMNESPKKKTVRFAKEEYESQIEFLNSVVVDMQRKCDDYKNRLAQIDTVNVVNELDNLIMADKRTLRQDEVLDRRVLEENKMFERARMRGLTNGSSTSPRLRGSSINGNNGIVVKNVTQNDLPSRFRIVDSTSIRPTRISGRPYCDICNVYDLHHTIYCPSVSEKLTSRDESFNGSMNNNNNNNFNNNNDLTSNIKDNANVLVNRNSTADDINIGQNDDYLRNINSRNVDEMFREYEESIKRDSIRRFSSLRRPAVAEKPPPRAYCDHCDLFGHTVKSCSSLMA